MLKITKQMAALLILAGLMTACAQTATEIDFGNSARALAAAQTMHPEGMPATGPEVGDGKRLETVVKGYRETAGDRGKVGTDVRFGFDEVGQ